MYAQAIARAFTSFKNKIDNIPLEIPTLLYANNHWENSKMLTPLQVGIFSNGWQNINPIEHENLKAFAPWFNTISKTNTDNASVSFKFKGSAFGFFDIGGPEVGQVLIEVDGNCVELTRKAGNVSNVVPNETSFKCLNNRFNSFCNNRYRGQFELFEVADGVHEVKISLSNLIADKMSILKGQDIEDITNNPYKYNQRTFYLGKILIKGDVLK